MNKTKAIKMLLEISAECNNADKCNQCAFYNLVANIEGCIFEELKYRELPKDYREVLIN